jgi:CRP/FNR family transcriptional regulator, cyclic AMP receptor protein
MPEQPKRRSIPLKGILARESDFHEPRFRKMGFIEYNGGLEVHSSVLNVILHD